MLEEWSREGILREPPKLVLAGGKGWLYDSIFETVREFGLDSQVVFTGYVEESQVPVLMKGARAFVFPSLYEGFGMPPLEAMACGTPVLTSTAASLPRGGWRNRDISGPRVYRGYLSWLKATCQR